ncbi:MAG TPA: hypothetical protein VGW32_09015, partial [Pyrinomonadaceae bacterium]|nr:hypothetical protein [Pyrinomonadaceae bacterium]
DKARYSKVEAVGKITNHRFCSVFGVRRLDGALLFVERYRTGKIESGVEPPHSKIVKLRTRLLNTHQLNTIDRLAIQ